MININIPILFFLFSFIALIIGVFQFINGEIWEPLLSLVYALVFFAGGMISRFKDSKG
jgi:hypothetical protein